MSDALRIGCPTCNAAAGDRCRTLKTRRSTDTHSARYVLWGELQQQGKDAHPSSRRHLRLVT